MAIYSEAPRGVCAAGDINASNTTHTRKREREEGKNNKGIYSPLVFQETWLYKIDRDSGNTFWAVCFCCSTEHISRVLPHVGIRPTGLLYLPLCVRYNIGAATMGN